METSDYDLIIGIEVQVCVIIVIYNFIGFYCVYPPVKIIAAWKKNVQ